MAARFAWVLNLDADLELAALASGATNARAGYTPKRGVMAAMRTYVPKLAASLLDPAEDVLVDETTPALAARGLLGRAFCPTPRALALLRRAGAEPEAHPPWEVLARVNARAFASSLGATLPSAAFVTRDDAACAHLAAAPPPELAAAWRVKRNFGMAGRGQRVVAAGAPTAEDLAFVRAGLAEGGVQIEPDLAIVREYAVHGRLSQGGALTVGGVVLQLCDARGAWLSAEPLAKDLVPARLIAEAELVGAALTAGGYFGPFGVDAYCYRMRGGEGAVALQPRSEINARYTMGFGG